MILLLALLLQDPPSPRTADPLTEAEREMRAARGFIQPEFLAAAVLHQLRALESIERMMDRFDPPPRFAHPLDALLPVFDRTPAGTPIPEGVELLRELRKYLQKD